MMIIHYNVQAVFYHIYANRQIDMKLGDPPTIEFRSACKKCGSVQGFKWTYGQNDGQSTGFSTCQSCGATSK